MWRDMCISALPVRYVPVALAEQPQPAELAAYVAMVAAAEQHETAVPVPEPVPTSDGQSAPPSEEVMDNAAFESNGEMPHRTASTTVEMGELTRPTTERAPAATTPTAPLCKPDLCIAMRPLQAKTAGTRPNPWHRYKTILLVATVVGLVVWAFAYFILAYFGVLA